MLEPGFRIAPGHPDLVAFLARARGRLLAAPPRPAMESVPFYGDHRLAPEILRHSSPVEAKPAAVLIAIIDRPDGPAVLFTERAAHLRSHSGQIAFPGGRIDAGDAGPVAAALREAEEETGLSAKLVQPVGCLDFYLSNSGYRIVPVVALADPAMVLTPNRDEVAGLFECPLAFLMNPANHLTETREWRGAMHRYYAMRWQGHYIWGVTGGIVRALYETVYPERAAGT